MDAGSRATQGAVTDKPTLLKLKCVHHTAEIGHLVKQKYCFKVFEQTLNKIYA